MVWTLENIFYVLGIVFLIVMLLTMIVSVVAILVFIRKAKQFGTKLKAQLANKEQSSAGKLIKTLMPLVVSIGLRGGYKSLLRKFRL